MWLVLLTKYWKEAILLAVIIALISAFGIDEIQDNHRIAELGKAAAYASNGWEQCQLEWKELYDLNEFRNGQIDSLNTEIANRQKALEEALAKPPKVIYRDKIVEVPSIATGTCEEVVIDISEYIEDVVNE